MPNFEMQEPQDDSYSSESLSLPFTVKVEVEAVDETPIEVDEPQPDHEDETVKTEWCDADDTEKSTIDSKVNNVIRRKGTFLTQHDIYKIDKEKVFEELQKISTTSDNIADKLLAIEVRNTWGHSFYQKHIDSAMNHKMSVCLGKWAAWSLSRSCFNKDTPVAYICYVCNLGWWYLAPFMDHVNSNHEDANLIYFQTTDFESIIVLKVNDNKIRKPIRIYGACPKCGRDADCHKGLQLDFYAKNRYRCTYCKETFVTCSLWSRHMGSCQKYLEHVQTSPVVDNLFTCHLCAAVREKVELIEEHYIYSHSVRSDVPAYVQLKFCKICDQLTPCLLAHPCPVKKPSRVCLWCLKRFSTGHLLRLHEAINNSPTHCPLCKETLPSKCSLVAHMAKAHSDNYLLVPKCVLCVEHTVFLNEASRNAHICRHHRKKYERGYYGLSVIIPRTCIPSNKPAPKDSKTRIFPNDIPTLKVAPSTFDHADTYKITSFKNTPNNIDLDIMDPSDNLDQIVVKEVCGNFVDHTDLDSQSNQGEYVNTSSGFYPSSDDKVKTEPTDVETELCTEQIEDNTKQEIKEDIEENTMENEEGILEDEMGVECETIVKEEVIADHDTVNYEDILAIMFGIKKENSDEDRKENTPAETVKGELLEEIICSKSQSSDESDSDSIVEYTPLTSYFCNKKDMVCCKRCQNIFSPVKYKLHVQFCNKRVYCTSCIKHYENMKIYCKHFAAEHGFERLQCPICKDSDIKGPFVYHIKRHVVQTFVSVSCLTHTADGPKLHIEYKCKRCLKKVGVNSVLAHWEVHYSRTRCDDGNSDDVDANPTNKTETNENIDENSREKENIEKVIEILLQKNNRYRRRDCRKKPDYGITCLLCKKVFQRHSRYKIHLIEHVLEYAQQNYDRHSALKCPVCLANLSEMNKFRQHMRDHANLVTYTCTICQRNYGNSSNFAKHKKTHNYNILPCEVCGKKFQQDYQLQKHLEMHKSLGSITCSCCNKLFFDASTHKRHLRAEAFKKKPPTYNCKTCKQKFSNTITLKDHEWNVHKIRRFKVDCPKCKQPFRKFSDLKRHLKDTHFVNCSKNEWKKLIGTKATLEKIVT